MTPSYYLYILYSANADKYYVGYTTDYQKRVEDHNSQEFFSTYTSKHRPWLLAAVFLVGQDEALAVKLERFIKKQKSRRL
ncbi:MAG: GIY-YIG nuclease family protein, partial [Bacteroidota bacterium]